MIIDQVYTMIKGITYLIEVEHQFYFYSKHQKKKRQKKKKIQKQKKENYTKKNA